MVQNNAPPLHRRDYVGIAADPLGEPEQYTPSCCLALVFWNVVSPGVLILASDVAQAQLWRSPRLNTSSAGE